MQEQVIVCLILFIRLKFSCCLFFWILITASAVDSFEFPFAKVMFLNFWLDWRLLFIEWICRHIHVLSHECLDDLDVQILIKNSIFRCKVVWNLLASDINMNSSTSWLISNDFKYLWPCVCSYVWYVVDSVHSCQSK